MPEGQEIPATVTPAAKPSRFKSAWEAIKNFKRGREKPVTPIIPEPAPNLPDADNPSITLEPEKPEAEKPESIPDMPEVTVEENPELNAFTREELRQFFEFSEKHQDLIQDELAKGEALADILYDNFCLRDIDHPTYYEGDPEIAEKIRWYMVNTHIARDEIQANIDEGKLTNVEKDRATFGYLQHRFNGGIVSRFQDSDKIGRFYLDIDIDRLLAVYQKGFVRLFSQADPPIHSIMKIFEPLISGLQNLPTLNRFDKLVVYFEESEQEAVYALVERLYSSGKPYFLDGTPRFSAPVMDSKGQIMKGVSFGQEPTFEASEQQSKSFSYVRAEIFAELYKAQELDPKLGSNEDRLAKLFFEVCKENDVDPNHPAFNLGSDKFQFIRSKVPA